MSLDSILRATGKNLANCGEKSDWYSNLVDLSNISVSEGTVSYPAMLYATAVAFNKNRIFTNGETFTFHSNLTAQTAGNVTYRYVIKLYKNDTVIEDITIDGWTYNEYYHAYWTNNSKSFTLPKDMVNSFEWGLVFFATGDISAGTVLTYSNIQIEKGSVVTDYEPYEYLGPKSIKMGSNSKNLIQYPYTETTKTQKGITFTDNGDGTITVNGTSTGVVTFTLGSVSLDNAKSYFLSGKNTSSNLPLRIQIGQVWNAEVGNGLAISQEGGNHYTITLTALKGHTFDNVIIYPQLEEGSVATDYELNTGSKEVLKVSYNSRNLLPYPWATTTKTQNGITFTDNGDGSLTISGTATAETYFSLQRGRDYGNQPINAIETESATNGKYAVSKRLYYNGNSKVLSVNILNGATINETIYPQIELGNKATDYVPYFNTVVWEKEIVATNKLGSFKLGESVLA